MSSNPYEPPAPDHTPKSERTPITGRDKWAAGPFNFQLAMAIVPPAWLLPSEARVSWFGASLRRGRDPDWMVNTLIAAVAISAVLSLAVLIAVWSGRPIRYLLARCSAAMFAIWGAVVQFNVPPQGSFPVMGGIHIAVFCAVACLYRSPRQTSLDAGS